MLREITMARWKFCNSSRVLPFADFGGAVGCKATYCWFMSGNSSGYIEVIFTKVTTPAPS
jgi:hypothetical protein